MPGRYVSDTSQHCVTVTRPTWVWKEVTVACWDVYVWEWPSLELVGEATARVDGDAVEINAPNASDAVGYTFPVTPNVQQTLTLDIERMNLNDKASVEVMEQRGKEWVTLAETPVEVSSGGLEIPFKPSGNYIKVVWHGRILVWVRKDCISKLEWVEEDQLVTICDGDKDKYRFGFNGQEKVNEWSGVGNYVDFGARGYDSRIGRWLSVDKLAYKHPSLSPFGYCVGNPIKFQDPDGNDVKVTITKNSINFSSTIYVIGPGAEDLASDANTQFSKFSAIKGRTYTDVSASVTYNVSISMNFVAVDPNNPNDPNYAGYMEVKNAKPGVNGNNLLIITNEPENLFNGRANAGNPAGNLYSKNYYTDNFTSGNGMAQANKIRGVGNMAYVAMGDGAGTAVHETFHNFGLGDRYFESLIYHFVDALGHNGDVPVQASQIGFENDIMSKESRATNLTGVDFNQAHINNLARAALSTYKATKRSTFIMGKKVDNENSANTQKAPKTFQIDGTTYSREGK